MKKIVGILGMAAVLASAVFAAEPAANFVMSEFKGDASLDFNANFVDSSFGMKNAANASIKFGIFTEGTKATTGDGIWGDLQIKCAAMDWAGGSLAALPIPTVEVAKIHFVDGDFAAALNILTPSLVYGAYAPMMATPAGIEGVGIGKDLTDKAGFGVEVSMKDLFALNFKFVDNGVKKSDAKKFGLAFDAALNAVPNLTAKVMGSFNFDAKYTGIGAEAGYELAIADGLYLKPGVAFTFANEADVNTMNLAAGVMFGAGAKDCEPGLDFIADKTNEGASVAVSTNMKDNGLKLAVGAYYESLFSKLGLDDFGQLKLGAEYVFAQAAADTLKAAAKYHLDFSPLYFNVHGGMQLTMPETGDTTTEYKVGVGVGTKEIIDNTDVYAKYELAGASAVTTNALTIGTKISF